MCLTHNSKARIQEFSLDDTPTFRHATDVVAFARSVGLYQGPDHLFSFSDVFDPVTPYGLRMCEARVYSFFLRIQAPGENIEKHLDYVRGFNMKNRMPLYVRVARKLSVNDTFWLMRDHFEGSPLDNSWDISGGAWHMPATW